MTIKLANNVSGFLNTAITASDTGIVLQSGNGASFPSLGAGEYFYATLVSTGNTLEVVKVTARSGDSMTVVRAQDGTSAASFAAGSRLEMRINAAAVRDAIGDVVASQVGFTPVGGIAATDVQAALAEVDSEKIAFTRLDDSDGSSLVGFLQAGTGAQARTVQAKLRDVVSVFDFMTSAQIADVQAGTAAVDVTAAIQNGVDECVIRGQVLFMPAGSYRVTDTINIPSFTQIVGEHKNSNPRSFALPRGTQIFFNPTSAKSLFVATGAPPFGSFRSSYSIEGLYIEGNSSSASGNSIYAIDVDSVVRSAFRDIAVRNFRTGIRCFATINNRFEFVRVGTCYEQCVLYAGGIATTDVWDQCYLANAPIGVQTSGASLAIRFSNCIFESFDNYGVNLVREVYGWQFFNTYAEDVPGTNNANGCMFRVGHDGTTLAGSPQLFVHGGWFGGNNSVNVGAAFDVDFTDGVYAGGFFAGRYDNVVKTSANTQTNQIILNGGTSAQINAQYSDSTKISGMFGVNVFNSGNRNQQDARVRQGFIQQIRPGTFGVAIWTSGAGTPEGNVTAPVGSLYTDNAGGAGTVLYIKESGSGNTGWVAK